VLLPVQAHKARHHESKKEKGFGTPNVSFPASSRQRICSFLQLLVGQKKAHNFAMWKRNKLVFLRNPTSSKGMAEARPVHHSKSTRCKTLISGRLSAKAKKARSLKPWFRLKSSCSNEVFRSRADTSSMNSSSSKPASMRY
jgi:hypothetical protein